MIKLLDLISSLGIIIAVYLCGTKPRIGWLIYFLNSFLYCYCMFSKGLIFLGIGGIILAIIGFKNFLTSKKENKNE